MSADASDWLVAGVAADAAPGAEQPTNSAPPATRAISALSG